MLTFIALPNLTKNCTNTKRTYIMQSKVNCIFIIILVTILKSNARRRQPKFSVVVIQLCLISKIKKFANIKKKTF